MLGFISDLLFPIQCLGGCGHYDQWLCAVCATRAFAPLKVPGNNLELPGLGRIQALGLYNNAILRRCIIELKYSGYFGVAKVLGNALRQIIPSNQYDYVIPVPLQRQRQRERGFNQTELIARQLALPILPLLEKRQQTATQATLKRADRLHNLKTAFSVNARLVPQVRQQRILLLDDVLSTGATLTACATVLQQTGCKYIDAAVIALNDDINKVVPWEGIEPSASRTATGRSIH